MNRVILGDNHAIFRAGIAKVFASSDDFRVVAQCDDVARMMRAIKAYPASIIVFASALDAAAHELFPLMKAVKSSAIVIAEKDESAIFYTQLGARGVVYREITGPALIDCVLKVMRGMICVQYPGGAEQREREQDFVGARVRDRLTPQEMKVLALIAQGCRNKEIAQRLGTTEQVIKNYLRRVYDKAGVSDRLELALFTNHHRVLAAAAHGII